MWNLENEAGGVKSGVEPGGWIVASDCGVQGMENLEVREGDVDDGVCRVQG